MTALAASHEELAAARTPVASGFRRQATARAYYAALEQGKGNEMADALFAAEDLSPGACEKLAVKLGLALPAFRDAVSSTRVEARIDADIAWFKRAGVAGVPAFWVEDEVFIGPGVVTTNDHAMGRHPRDERLPAPVFRRA